ncbi:hypothetical protein ASE48_31830 [Mycobacterium sp. Root265]|nr:hypothetical protein ASE48_31830 [Mycobacterium sp. Root265]
MWHRTLTGPVPHEVHLLFTHAGLDSTACGVHAWHRRDTAPYQRTEGPRMIPFICTSCGHIDIDSAECVTCAQAPAKQSATDAAVA